jgi:hypothetical protein
MADGIDISEYTKGVVRSIFDEFLGDDMLSNIDMTKDELLDTIASEAEDVVQNLASLDGHQVDLATYRTGLQIGASFGIRAGMAFSLAMLVKATDKATDIFYDED